MAKDDWQYYEAEGTWLDPGVEDDANRGIKSLILEILMRAYFDSVGLFGGLLLSDAGKRKVSREATLFLWDKIKSDFGTATEMSILATGTDKFIKYLREQHTKNNNLKQE